MAHRGWKLSNHGGEWWLMSKCLWDMESTIASNHRDLIGMWAGHKTALASTQLRYGIQTLWVLPMIKQMLCGVCLVEGKQFLYEHLDSNERRKDISSKFLFYMAGIGLCNHKQGFIEACSSAACQRWQMPPLVIFSLGDFLDLTRQWSQHGTYSASFLGF